MTLGLLAFTILAFVVLFDRKDRRAHEERSDRATQTIDEHNAHRMEVLGLLQRIQAPELAVVQHQQETFPDSESYPLSDAETAERQAEVALAIQHMERIENEMLPQ